MKKLFFGHSPVFLSIAVVAALVPGVRAQSQGSATRIVTVPAGLTFYVDGQGFSQTISPVWPAGSKHTLWIPLGGQSSSDGAQYTFQGWQCSLSSGCPVGNPITITADPAITQYSAVFAIEGYTLSVRYFSCADAQSCQASPGTVTANGQAYSSDFDMEAPPGGSVVLQGFPNPGWVLSGWETPLTAPGVVTPGFQVTIPVNGPTLVVPVFLQANPISFATVPPGLQVYTDTLPVTTPFIDEWGFGTTHSIGAVTPQSAQGGWWVFSSWSDGGATTHSVQAPNFPAGAVLFTATYVPGTTVNLQTAPAGLRIKVDGRDLAPPYYYTWGMGQTHRLEAATPQIDTQGAAWQFSGWSNGAASSIQDFTVPVVPQDQGVVLTALFTPLGRLTVTSPVNGLSIEVDGTACATPCQVLRPVGTQVQVAAPASLPLTDGSRQDLLGWSNGSGPGALAITLGTAPLTVSPNYHSMNRLSTSASPPEGASWKLAPSSPDGFYDSQAIVSVSVTAMPGYRFHGWSGDLSGSYPSGTLPMTTPKAVTAQFDKVPYIAPAGVSNGAGATPQAGVAPGSVVSVFGASLASATVAGPASPLVETLANVTVQIGDRLLPLYFASPGQINLQLPADIPEGQQTLTVSSPGQPDVRAAFPVVRDAPGLFPQAIGGQTLALALHQDGTLVTPDSPARKGELITVYGTGFGPTRYPRPEGFPVPQTPACPVLDAVSVWIDQAAVTPDSAFAVPGRIGVDAVRFRLADSTSPGAIVALHVTINGQDSNTLLLPVQ